VTAQEAADGNSFFRRTPVQFGNPAFQEAAAEAQAASGNAAAIQASEDQVTAQEAADGNSFF
jgi:hypothetical protein